MEGYVASPPPRVSGHVCRCPTLCGVNRDPQAWQGCGDTKLSQPTWVCRVRSELPCQGATKVWALREILGNKVDLVAAHATVLVFLALVDKAAIESRQQAWHFDAVNKVEAIVFVAQGTRSHRACCGLALRVRVALGLMTSERVQRREQELILRYR